jgi:hypothetical protein
MAGVIQNEEFGKKMLAQWPLDEAIDWIGENMYPSDVFSEEQLIEWAKENMDKIEEEEE